MTMIACCGHEINLEQLEKPYWWKEEDCLSCSALCPDCVPIYRAVEAFSYEEALVKLKDSEPVGLIDILEGTYGGKREVRIVGDIPFEVYEVP